MKKLATLFFLSLSILSYAQIGLDFYDLPKWGETYYRHVIPMMSEGQIPASVYDSTDTELYWDFTSFGTESEPDTANYYWVEGTSAAFDFPDANMADYDPNNDNGQYQYFIKDETGFYFSGRSGGFNTPQGTFDIKAEFRPAVPIMKVPAKYGDEVSETSRSSVDLLTFGNVRLTTYTNYKINGYGKVKIPTGEEYEVLRVKRVTRSEVIFSIQLGQTKIEDTTLNIETAWEFYTPHYGDAIASISKTFDENIGLDQYSMYYKDQREVSSIAQMQQSKNMTLLYIKDYNTVVLKDEDLVEGGSIEVFDMGGQLIYETESTLEVNQITTQGIKPGTYILKTNPTHGTPESKSIIIY